MLKKILHEPLVHFFLVGSLLFFYLSKQDDMPAKEQLVITKGKIKQLKAQYAQTRQQAPSPDEFQALIENQIREDLAFQYGMELGLVENDTIIKRRVQQKIEFMLDDSIATLEPTKKELQDYMNAHRSQYTIAPVYTFKHIYINPQAHEDFDLYLKNLKSEKLDLVYANRGDSTMLESLYENISTAQIARLFGLKFAEALDAVPLSTWLGPVKSGYGVHLVYIEKKKKRHFATLDEVASKVKLDFRVDAQKKALDAFYTELKKKYNVTIEELK